MQCQGVLHFVYIVQTAVVISSLSFNRSSSIYEEPHRFNPDRWNDRETRRFTAFSNIPFGFGPRACYGKVTLYDQLMLSIMLYVYSPKSIQVEDLQNLSY